MGLDSESMSTWGAGAKCFFKQGMNPYRRFFMAIFHSIGITYKEYLADQRKVRQLNSLLAELSGRKIEEFEQTGTIEKLIKGEQK